MVKALYNGVVIAESDNTVMVDGNHYFPADSLNTQHFEGSDHTTVCGWKGTANYHNVVVDGKKNENAAWVYNSPKEKAEHIKGHVAFWKGVEVVN